MQGGLGVAAFEVEEAIDQTQSQRYIAGLTIRLRCVKLLTRSKADVPSSLAVFDCRLLPDRRAVLSSSLSTPPPSSSSSVKTWLLRFTLRGLS